MHTLVPHQRGTKMQIKTAPLLRHTVPRPGNNIRMLDGCQEGIDPLCANTKSAVLLVGEAVRTVQLELGR